MNRILVVDDEERIRQMFKAVLEQKGYRVVTAATAMEAKDFVVREKVDLILLDINMGEVNGDVFSIVSRAFHPDIKIIVSSVFPMEEQHEMIGDADDYFDKSDGFSILIEKVEKALK